jgi:phospholipid transport system substrate-binding protein
VLLVFSVSGSRAETVADEEPRLLIEQITQEIVAGVAREGDKVLSQDGRAMELVDAVASAHTDFVLVSRLVLGQTWKGMEADQRARFVEEMRTLLLRTYASLAVRYASAEMSYSPTRKSKDQKVALIRCQVKPGLGSVKHVDYRLRLKDGEWKMFDVAFDGVSLVATFRSSFQAEVKKSGVDGMLAKLTAKNRSFRAAIARS